MVDYQKKKKKEKTQETRGPDQSNVSGSEKFSRRPGICPIAMHMVSCFTIHGLDADSLPVESLGVELYTGAE